MLRANIPAKLVALLVVVMKALSPALAQDPDGTPSGSFIVSKNPHIVTRSELLQISQNKIRVSYIYENTSDEAQSIFIGFPVIRFDHQLNLPPLLGTLDVRTWINGEEYQYENTDLKSGEECRSRWLERNRIFYDAGYCFENDRSLKVFSNEGCIGKAVDFTPAEQTRIERLRSEESVLGCSFIEHPNIPQIEYSASEYNYYLFKTTKNVREQYFEPGSFVEVVHEYVPNYTTGIFEYWVPYFRDLDKLSTHWFFPYLYLQCATQADALVAVEAWEKFFERTQERRTWPSGITDWRVIDYILTTGTNWRGPIGHFRLEIFDENPLLISTCFEGLERVAENRYVFEAFDYVPTENLSVALHTVR